MPIDFKLYLIIDRRLFSEQSQMFAAVEDALKAGVKAVQLREKDLNVREILSMAYEMRDLTTKYDAKLFINDRVDIALCVNADGVHIGQSGLPAYAARKIAESKMLIGLSTHSIKEAEEAEADGADFITFGPIYETPSKLKYGNPLGGKELKKVVEKVSIPVLGIGGIKPGNVSEVLKANANGVALISGILGASNVADAAIKYLNALGEKT